MKPLDTLRSAGEFISRYSSIGALALSIIALGISIYTIIVKISPSSTEWMELVQHQTLLQEKVDSLGLSVTNFSAQLRELDSLAINLNSAVERITTKEIENKISDLEVRMEGLKKEYNDLRDYISPNNAETRATIADVKTQNQSNSSDIRELFDWVKDIEKMIFYGILSIIGSIIIMVIFLVNRTDKVIQKNLDTLRNKI